MVNIVLCDVPLTIKNLFLNHTIIMEGSVKYRKCVVTTRLTLIFRRLCLSSTSLSYTVKYCKTIR